VNSVFEQERFEAAVQRIIASSLAVLMNAQGKTCANEILDMTLSLVFSDKALTANVKYSLASKALGQILEGYALVPQRKRKALAFASAWSAVLSFFSETLSAASERDLSSALEQNLKIQDFVESLLNVIQSFYANQLSKDKERERESSIVSEKSAAAMDIETSVSRTAPESSAVISSVNNVNSAKDSIEHLRSALLNNLVSDSVSVRDC
jgi:hypothetical protein